MKRIGDNTKPEFRVRLRGGFSDRNNIKPENKEMQFESLKIGPERQSLT